jgi:hypothetical protein
VPPDEAPARPERVSTLLLHCCYTIVTLLSLFFHCWYTVVTLLHCRYTVVTLL